MNENDPQDAADPVAQQGGDERRVLDRRVALQKLAIHGAVTAPLLMAILTSEKAIAQSGGGGCGTDCVFDG